MPGDKTYISQITIQLPNTSESTVYLKDAELEEAVNNLGASDVGAVASDQGSGNAGKFLVVNSNGTVVPMTMSAWQGGSY